VGSIVNKVTGSLGLTADPSAGAAERQQADALQQRAVLELEKLGIPSVEAQKIVLEQPELVLSSLEERLGPSAFEDIQIDPRLQEAELDALSALQQAGEEGFTAEDRARIEALRSQIGADEQARQASILQQMAQRGALDSGAQLAAQLGSSQAATQRASQEGLELAAQQAAARRNALAQAGQMASQMGSRQFSQDAQKAQASDAIRQFNAAVAARDTAAKQQQAQQRASIANQQEMYNKGLLQQNFQNQLAKATGVTGALGNQAQQAMQSAAQQASAAQQEAAGTRGLLIGGARAAMMARDGGMKGMNYQAGGQGTIIESNLDSYAGDELPDRINDGEMVLNLDQQNMFNNLLKELADRRRADENVDNGNAIVNEAQQETLMDIARGEAQPEDLGDQQIVERIPQEASLPMDTSNLEGLLNNLQNYQDGGIAQPLDLNNIVESLANLDQPEVNMSFPQQEVDYSQMMSVGEPTKIQSPKQEIQDIKGDIEAQQVDKTNEIVESPNAPKVEEQVGDEELEDARRKDMIINLLGVIDDSLGHYDAANKNAILQPIKRDLLQGNLEEKLMKARQLASAKNKEQALIKYRQEQLDLQKQSMERTKEEKDLKRKDQEARAQERKGKEARLQAKDELNAARNLLKDDPRYKKAVEQGMEFESVNRLLDQVGEGNQAALAALGTKLARAMGEVGVLTDTDVVRYVGGTSWGRKLKDWYAKGAKGELSKDTLNDIKSNLKLLRGKLKDDTSRVYDNASGRMKTAFPNMADEKIRGLLGKTIISEDETKKQASSDSRLIKVKRKKDGMIKSLPVEQAEKYLSDPRFERVQ